MICLLHSSTELDKWTTKQLAMMRFGGNNKANKFFREHGWTDTPGAKVG